MRRNYSRFAMLAAGLLISHIVSADDQIVTRQVLVPADSGRTLSVWAIAPTADNGVIIGGSMDFDAWVAKVASDGRVLWRYNMLQTFKPRFPISNQIRGLVARPGGTTVACGNAVRPPDSPESGAFVVKLDQMGKALDQEFLSPPKLPPILEGSKSGLATISKCIAWKGGTAIVGEWSGSSPALHGGGVSRTEKFYWVIALDASGQMRWNKLFAATAKSVVGMISVVGSGNELLFSATDSVTTDVFRLSESGEMLAHQSLGGEFGFVDPQVMPASPKMLGVMDLDAATASHVTDAVLLDLNEQLREVARSPAMIKDLLGVAYRMPDESIVVIGRSGTPRGALAGVVHADRTLESRAYLELPRSRAPIFLNLAGDASAQTSSPGNFVFARTLVQMPSKRSTPSTPPEFRGVVIDFIQVIH